jgi:hypothetical protein
VKPSPIQGFEKKADELLKQYDLVPEKIPETIS